MHKADYMLFQRRLYRFPPFSCKKIAYVIDHRETIVIHTLTVHIPEG